MSRDGREVCAKTLAVCLAVCLATTLIHNRLSSTLSDPAFGWATSFAILQAVAVVFLSAYLLARRVFKRMQANVSHQIEPAIRDRILNLAFEGESWTSDVPVRGAARRAMEQSIADALNTLKATPRERVARFAVEQGFVAEWVHAFSSGTKAARKRAVALLGLVSGVAGDTVLPAALDDKQAAVRVEASRALISANHISTNYAEIETVFRAVLRESLLARALLADELKRHARYLVAHTIPALLATGDRLLAARCFEMLLAWKLALPDFEIDSWFAGEPDSLLWPLLLALLPYVRTHHADEYLLRAWNSSDVTVLCAAARSAGKLRAEQLIPALTDALAADAKPLALAAAKALAHIGEAGIERLESAVIGSNRQAAAIAMEALEHATVRVH